MTRIYYDTEFIDSGSHIDLISIGMVTDTGSEYYAVSNEFSMKGLVRNQWLLDHVWPSLPQVRGDVRMHILARHRSGSFSSQVRLHEALFDRYDPAVKTRAEIAADVHGFIVSVQDPQLWAWYGAYDHVVLAQLFGKMSELPKGVPMHTCDLKQECDRLGNPRVPQQESGHHNALADARHNRVIAKYLDGLAGAVR
jgi:hypothetical protein